MLQVCGRVAPRRLPIPKGTGSTHPCEEGNQPGGPCCVDPECQDSHHTAREERHLYRTTAAGVSCERAVRDTLERTNVAITLDTSTSRALLENRGYCSEPLVPQSGSSSTSELNSVDPRIPAYVHRLQRGYKKRERARDGQTKHRAQGLALQVTAPFGRIDHDNELGRQKPRAQGLATQVTAPTLTSRSRQRVGQTKPRAQGIRDASDCTNRASKSGLARLRQHLDSVREWLYERKTRGHTKVSGRSRV